MPKLTEYNEIDNNSYIFTKKLSVSGTHVRINTPKIFSEIFGEDDVEIIVVRNKNKKALIKAIASVPSNK